MRVCVIGTGYVGLVTGACLSFVGHSVIGVDRDARKIAILKEGISPIYEPGIERLIEVEMKRGSLAFTSDIGEAALVADVMLFAVGTPGLPDGRVDLRNLERAARAVGHALAAVNDSKLRIIANKSTVPVGSGDWIEEIIRSALVEARNPAGSSLNSEPAPLDQNMIIASNPEFLREGSAIKDCLYPDRIVIGADDERAISILTKLYEPILEQSFSEADYIPPRPDGCRRVPLVTIDRSSAEVAKYAANAFLSLKIGFANEIANICERVGADVTKVMQAVGLDHRIGPEYLNAGIGWGGSCLGKDVSALVKIAEDYGYGPELLKASLATNRSQRLTVIEKVQAALGSIEGKTIGLLGVAFKPNSDDTRDAPSLTIARTLLERGARVKVYDPVAMNNCRAECPDLGLIYASDPMDLASKCDALVLVTEWEEFRSLNLVEIRGAMAGGVFVDGRNVFDPQAARAAGFNYIGVGRSEK